MKTLLILLFGCACGTALPEKYADVDGRIVNGNNAKRHQFPYIVSIQIKETHWCGASILSQKWLVSAGHGFYQQPSHFVAVAGLLTQGESHRDIQTSPIEEIIVHPNYVARFLYNDIALLSLRFPFTFSEAVQGVHLPQPNAQPNGAAVISECNEILATTTPSDTSYPFLVRNTMICTKPNETDESACYGDSGGPLVQNNVLIGIVQIGDTACGTRLSDNTTYPNIFTRVSSFIDFIGEHVKDGAKPAD